MEINCFLLDLFVINLLSNQGFAEGGFQGDVAILARRSAVNRLLEEDVVQVPGREDLVLVEVACVESRELIQTPVDLDFITAAGLPTLLL